MTSVRRLTLLRPATRSAPFVDPAGLAGESLLTGATGDGERLSDLSDML
jgi:hypothetical protein